MCWMAASRAPPSKATFHSEYTLIASIRTSSQLKQSAQDSLTFARNASASSAFFCASAATCTACHDDG